MQALTAVLLLACVGLLHASPVRVSAEDEECKPLCQMFHSFLDQDGDGYATLEELVKYFDEFDQRKIGRRNVMKVAEMMLKWDANRDERVSYQEFAAYYPTLADVELTMTPSEVHVQLVDNNGVMIMWVTQYETDTTTVEYGTISNTSLTSTAYGSTHTYTAGGWKGVIHQVLLSDLAPQTRYYYRVGDPTAGWSQVFSFVTRPLQNDTATHIVGMYGDMGTAIPAGFEVCEQMEEDNADLPFQLLVHVGDIAYASVQSPNPDPTDPKSRGPLRRGVGDEQEGIWDIWFNQIEPLAGMCTECLGEIIVMVADTKANIPYVAGVGNHEKFYNYSSYLARFRNPSPWGEDYDNILNSTFWFSFDYGRVHYTMMSTEHPYDIGSPQYEWLQADLAKANANRDNVPWIILTGHRPMYCSDQDEQSSHWPGAYFQQVIEPLMHEYDERMVIAWEESGVDMYVCGHMHMYERVNPVLNGTVYQTGNVYTNPGAPVHVVQGTSGVFQDFKFVHPQPDWSASRMGKLGYGRMHVYNATHIFYEFLGLESRAQEDSFWLIKN